MEINKKGACRWKYGLCCNQEIRFRSDETSISH